MGELWSMIILYDSPWLFWGYPVFRPWTLDDSMMWWHIFESSHLVTALNGRLTYRMVPPNKVVKKTNLQYFFISTINHRIQPSGHPVCFCVVDSRLSSKKSSRCKTPLGNLAPCACMERRFTCSLGLRSMRKWGLWWSTTGFRSFHNIFRPQIVQLFCLEATVPSGEMLPPLDSRRIQRFSMKNNVVSPFPENHWLKRMVSRGFLIGQGIILQNQTHLWMDSIWTSYEPLLPVHARANDSTTVHHLDLCTIQREFLSEVLWISYLDTEFKHFVANPHRSMEQSPETKSKALTLYVYMEFSWNGGCPKWMVYNGKSSLNGWFGGTSICFFND